MSRFPAAAKNAKTKTFKIADGHRIGCPSGSGKTLVGGDPIKLTKGQADYLYARGALNIGVDFDEPVSSDETEESSGSETDRSGDAPSGAGAGSDLVQEETESKEPRAGKSSL